jgi:hypothetical protein
MFTILLMLMRRYRTVINDDDTHRRMSSARRGWDVLSARLAVLFVVRSAPTEGVVWARQIHHYTRD